MCIVHTPDTWNKIYQAAMWLPIDWCDQGGFENWKANNSRPLPTFISLTFPAEGHRTLNLSMPLLTTAIQVVY